MDAEPAPAFPSLLVFSAVLYTLAPCVPASNPSFCLNYINWILVFWQIHVFNILHTFFSMNRVLILAGQTGPNVILTNCCCCLVTKSCPTLLRPLGLQPGSSVSGISQTRILKWVAIVLPRGSFWPKDWIEPTSPALAGEFFPTELPGKPVWTDKPQQKSTGDLEEIFCFSDTSFASFSLIFFPIFYFLVMIWT